MIDEFVPEPKEMFVGNTLNLIWIWTSKLFQRIQADWNVMNKGMLG